MRWLYHICPAPGSPLPALYAPDSLAREGFISELGRLVEFDAIATNSRVVDEGQLVTGGGVTCALDLGIHLVRRLEGDETAEAIARQMELPA